MTILPFMPTPLVYSGTLILRTNSHIEREIVIGAGGKGEPIGCFRVDKEYNKRSVTHLSYVVENPAAWLQAYRQEVEQSMEEGYELEQGSIPLPSLEKVQELYKNARDSGS